MLYQGVFQPKVEYPLAQSFLIEKQMKKIESVSVPKIMAKCGYNRTTALPIRGGPKTRWGRILFIPEHNRSISCTTLLEELENNLGRYWKSTTYSDGMDSI